MKKSNLQIFALVIISMVMTTGLKAQLPALTNGYPLFPQGTFVSGQTGYIDINGDNTNDFLITYYTSGSSTWYIVSSVNSTNMLAVEYPSVGSPALTTPGTPFVRLFGPNETIGNGPVSPAPLNDSSIDWALSGVLASNTYYLPYTATSMTTNNGYMGAYLSGGYYGWAYFTNVSPGSYTYSSATTSSSSGSPITTPGAVPVPFIASILALMGIGFGAYLRKRKKA